ncbi:hypothetical protein THRCLA_11784 [Thraustotheca clavata]|uniref:AVL9/DENND6 domain-containing protein n=1 Tax=Thraustotheca clavata TaxID=74557 RepID=A0A1V9Y6M6_9STRA|nr:hypothetical protein THRCLA_11784 [Thraustotheca clavata]
MKEKKAIVALFKGDIHGFIQMKLTALEYFEQKCDEDYTCLIELYDQLSTGNGPGSLWSIGLPVLNLVHTLGNSLLGILRLLMIQGRIVFFSSSEQQVSTNVIAFLSLLPGYGVVDQVQSYRLKKYGFPLKFLGKEHSFVIQPYMTTKELFNSNHGFFIGTSDPLALINKNAMDVLVDLESGVITWTSERGQLASTLGINSMASSNTILTLAQREETMEWVGSENWIRQQITLYLETFVSAIVYPKPRRLSLTNLFGQKTPLEVEHGTEWLEIWYTTYNYKEWSKAHSLSSFHAVLIDPPPESGHAIYTYANGDIYDGNFFHGKRHGHGRYTVYGTGYIYDGEWNMDARHGNGTLTTTHGTYSGSWSNNERSGNGEFKWETQKLKYNGYWKSNVYHGLGVLIDERIGFTYEGEFVNGHPHGVGKIVYTRGEKKQFSGEWFDGLFHGIGNLKYSNGEVYSGGFIKGQRHGQGTLITDDEEYDGEWQNDKRHGFGSLYSIKSKETKEGTWKCNKMAQGKSNTWSILYANGDKFNGEIQQGRPWGNGTCRYANGSVYTGEWVDGLRQGRGLFVDNDGTTFDGEWRNSQPCKESIYVEIPLTDPTKRTSDKNTIVYDNGDIYVGEMRQGKRHGRGKYTSKNSKHSYEGEWDMDLRHGQGTMTSGSHDFIYDGAWVQNTRTGFGTCVISGVESYSGQWYNNAFHGHGKYSEADGSVYEGEFLCGKKHGVGRWTSANGVVYQGEFADGEKHGVGTITYSDGSTYTGEFQHNQRHGEGTFTSSSEVFTGTWFKDQQHGHGSLTDTQNGTVKEGMWQYDYPLDGEWMIKFATKSVYTGACVKMRPHGEGVCKYANGDVYSGNWVHGVRSGWGICVFANGDVFEGEWTKNHVSLLGKGTLTMANGTIHAYEGERT